MKSIQGKPSNQSQIKKNSATVGEGEGFEKRRKSLAVSRGVLAFSSPPRVPSFVQCTGLIQTNTDDETAANTDGDMPARKRVRARLPAETAISSNIDNVGGDGWIMGRP